jgi:hypothetical protein
MYVLFHLKQLKYERVKNEFRLFLCLIKSFPARSAVKLSTRCALIEVRVCLFKLRRDSIVLILVEVQFKHKIRARSA